MSKQSRERREKWAKIDETRHIRGLVKRASIYDRIPGNGDGWAIRWGGKGAELRHTTLANRILVNITNLDTALKEESEWLTPPPLPILPFPRMILEWRWPAQRFDGGYIAVLDQDDDVSTAEIVCINFDHDPWIEPLGLVITTPDGVTVKGVTKFGYNGEVEEQPRYEPLWNWIWLAISLMHCHNVKLVDHEPDSADVVDFKRYFGAPLNKYKTLAIKAMSKLPKTDKPQQQFDIMPMHIRRGNFAIYTEDAPLFGKYTGTFWRPATVVGNEKNGIVVKDYKVKP